MVNVNQFFYFLNIAQSTKLYFWLTIKTTSSSSSSFHFTDKLHGFCFSQAGSSSRSFSCNCDTLTNLATLSAALIVLYICRHSSRVDRSNICSSRLVTAICCLLCAEGNHCSNVVIISIQCATLEIGITYSSAINWLNLKDYSAF